MREKAQERDVGNILRSIETPYIDSQTLLTLLSGYKKPREVILRMVKRGELIRLKNGVYLIDNKIKQGNTTLIPFEQVANFLYGPSYVSMEWALSFYGMIPERVYTITSATLGRNKEYRTPVGDFAYYTLPSKCYSTGVVQKKSPDFVGGFLMASPEKALADVVFKTCKNLSKNQLREELIQSKRMDSECFRNLNKALLEEIVNDYNTKSVYYLRDLVGVL